MNINLSLFAQALTFALFIWFTVKFVWPPLLRAIEQRQKQIAEGLAAAERGKQDLEEASRRTAELLREARQQAQDILGQAEKRGAEMIEEAQRRIRSGKASCPRRPEIATPRLGLRHRYCRARRRWAATTDEATCSMSCRRSFGTTYRSARGRRRKIASS